MRNTEINHYNLSSGARILAYRYVIPQNSVNVRYLVRLAVIDADRFLVDQVDRVTGRVVSKTDYHFGTDRGVAHVKAIEKFKATVAGAIRS